MAELTTLARPYAKAAFRHALEQGQLAQWSQMLSLVSAVVSDSTMHAYLQNPQLTTAQRADAVVAVVGDRIDAQASNLLRQLAENGRLSLLPQVADLFEQFKAEQESAVAVTVQSAFALDEAQLQALAASLAKRLDRKVQIEGSVDASLMGGVIVRAGDLVIDASIRGKLGKLRESLIS